MPTKPPVPYDIVGAFSVITNLRMELVSRLSTHLGGFLRPVTGDDLRPARPLARVMEGRGWRTTGNRGPGTGASTVASSLASAGTEALFTNLSEC